MNVESRPGTQLHLSRLDQGRRWDWRVDRCSFHVLPLCAIISLGLFRSFWVVRWLFNGVEADRLQETIVGWGECSDW